MDNYLNAFREMLSLRGLTDHTIVSAGQAKREASGQTFDFDLRKLF